MWRSICGDVFLNIFRVEIVTVRALDFYTGNFYKHVPLAKQRFSAQLILPVAQRKVVREVILAFVKTGEKGR